jgi:membrane protein
MFEDRALYLAALVTYYAFVSLFPLLLLFTSIAGFVLQGDPHARQQVLNSAFRTFPGLASELQKNITGFRGSGAGLAVGIVGVLYGGLGAMQAAQTAFNTIYAVPRNSQPDPIKSRIRSFGLLLLLGTGILVSTGISAVFATHNSLTAGLGVGVTVISYLVALVINVALFTAAVQLLTARDLKVGDVITGGAIAGILWQILQSLGSRYVAHEVSHGSAFYGVFGVVLATIAWIYLESLALMISAEINVVIHHQLWPRALLTLFTDKVELTPADVKAYSMYAGAQRFKGFEVIRATFDKHDKHDKPGEPGTPPGAPGAPGTPGTPPGTPGRPSRRLPPQRPPVKRR